MGNEIDLVICWVDDQNVTGKDLPVLELSKIIGKTETPTTTKDIPKINGMSIFPEDPAEDLLRRGESITAFEENVRQLDIRIKKLKDG